MIVLLLFSFIGGIITVLSPCILPLLPIILSSSVGESGRKRPLGIVTGFIASFTFFTLFLSTLVKTTGVPADTLRTISIVVIALFGITLLIPKFQLLIEQLFVKFQRFTPQSQNKTGFSGGLLLGASLGLLWAPCVGPILASVISLALTGEVTGSAFLITLAYSLGTAIPMFGIIYGGQNVLNKVPWLVRNSGTIQKAFGVLMIATALAIFLNWDRQFQTFILKTFPTYGTGLTFLEDNEIVENALESFGNDNNNEMLGKPMDLTTDSRNYPLAPEVVSEGQWFNVPEGIDELTLESLRGKVVLIDFWTYSCINCIRTLPYLRDWYATYKDEGFVIIGVHTPEFEFEKDPENVAKAISDFELTYPIVQDNNYRTWRAYSNRYWPAKYLIDKDGRVRYTHFGEGKYDQTEEMIQQLLKETGKEVMRDINNPTYSTASRTPETYLGYARMANFTSPEPVAKESINTYSLPNSVRKNTFAYEGTWFISKEYSSASAGSTLVFSYESKDVFLVMNPTTNSARVRIILDGEVHTSGEDVDENGYITITSDRLYELVSLSEPGEHTITIEFPDGNVEVYAFTFG